MCLPSLPESFTSVKNNGVELRLYEDGKLRFYDCGGKVLWVSGIGTCEVKKDLSMRHYKEWVYEEMSLRIMPYVMCLVKNNKVVWTSKKELNVILEEGGDYRVIMKSKKAELRLYANNLAVSVNEKIIWDAAHGLRYEEIEERVYL